MYFLADFSKGVLNRAVEIFEKHPRKVIGGAVIGGTTLGLSTSYLNKKDKRTFGQRLRDYGTVGAMVAAPAMLLNSRTANRLGDKVANIGNKTLRRSAQIGVVGGGLVSVPLLIEGQRRLTNLYSENVNKNRKEGQRIKKGKQLNIFTGKKRDYYGLPSSVE
jgi:hypothetical protein